MAKMGQVASSKLRRRSSRDTIKAIKRIKPARPGVGENYWQKTTNNTYLEILSFANREARSLMTATQDLQGLSAEKLQMQMNSQKPSNRATSASFFQSYTGSDPMVISPKEMKVTSTKLPPRERSQLYSKIAKNGKEPKSPSTVEGENRPFYEPQGMNY